MCLYTTPEPRYGQMWNYRKWLISSDLVTINNTIFLLYQGIMVHIPNNNPGLDKNEYTEWLIRFCNIPNANNSKNFRSHRTGSHYSDEDDGVDPADFVRICSNQMKRARVLGKIREIFADRVRAEESDKARSLTHNEPLLQLIINPDLSSGWLDAPKTADEPAGHWPRSTKFPSASGAQTVPEDAKKGNPTAFSIHYGSQPLRDFFKSPKWNHGTTRKLS